MPSKSKAQHNLMAAVANNKSFAKKVGIPQSVGRDYTAADKGRKFKFGGDTSMDKNAMKMAMLRKMSGKGMKSPSADMRGRAMRNPSADMMGRAMTRPAMGMKKGGEAKGMVKKEMAFMKNKGAPKSMIKHEKSEMKGYAKGGGIESKGKTRGKMVMMNNGGKC